MPQYIPSNQIVTGRKTKKTKHGVCTTYEDGKMTDNWWVVVRCGLRFGRRCCMLYGAFWKREDKCRNTVVRYFRYFGIGKIPIPNPFLNELRYRIPIPNPFLNELRYRIPIPDFRYFRFGSVSVSITDVTYLSSTRIVPKLKLRFDEGAVQPTLLRRIAVVPLLCSNAMMQHLPFEIRDLRFNAQDSRFEIRNTCWMNAKEYLEPGSLQQ